MIDMARRENNLGWILLTMLLAAAIRFDFLWASNFVVDADEAIVGLMAQHMAAGGDIPTFYYGQHYMGSLEPLMVSFLFRIWGSSDVLLKMVPFLWSLALIPLLFWFGQQLGSSRGGRIAALLGAIAPQPLVVWSSMARGGFVELMVIGGCALALTVIWARATKPKLSLLMFIGLLLGLGWWTNNQIIFFMVPIGLAVVGRLFYERRKVVDLIGPGILGLTSFLIGGLPFWLYNIRHDFITFDLFRTAGSSSGFSEQLERSVSTALPMLWGARRFWQSDDLFPGLTWLVLGTYGLLFLVILLRRAPMIAKALLLRFDFDRPVELFLLFWCSCVGIFAASSFGSLVEAPRYLLPAYLGSIPLVSFALVELAQVSRKIAGGGAALLIGFSLVSLYSGGRAIPGEPFVAFGQRVAADHQPLIAWLDQQQYRWVRTNYWIGYRLAFETKEQVRFMIFQPPTQVRITEYPRDFARSGLKLEELPMVLVPAQAVLIRRALKRLGISFEMAEVGEYQVIHKIVWRTEKLNSVKMKPSVIASLNHEAQNLAVDGDATTRWGSAAPQAPGMALTLTYKSPVVARGVNYELGVWKQDAPQGLEIVAELEDGTSKTLVSNSDYQAIKYLGEDRKDMEFRFAPVPVKKLVLTQTGTHPVFDWSVAEVGLEE